ncbi:hypothetical protein F5X96DRAFT_105575 [Biscogniauxia mediterranea]|nr:hypothetical protein F5X96DRAFT_105575 [Biscogniauxia mediterranea]
MDSPLLQTPKTGHSRFSKALPAPPPGLDDSLKLIPRKLPSLSASPLPPRKDSISAKSRAANLNLNLSPRDSPLPALPALPTLPALPASMETTQPPRQMNSIPRRPVAQPALAPTLATQPVDPSTVPRTNKMKRVSSISSILSAYSRTSSDSGNRLSQDSYHTKDSEPSYSPQQEGLDEKQQESTKAFSALSGNPYADEIPPTTDGTRELDQVPPPLPMKDPARPTTPSTIRIADSPTVPNSVSMTSSPVSSVNGSPGQREIWRRRASSKSDRNLAVTGLKLTTSHGSTAATLQAVKADPLPPPPPPAQNSTPTTAAALPPRGASLPGRNIRPNRPANLESNEEMVKLPGISKLKELAKRGTGSKDDQKEDVELQTKTQDQVESEAQVKSPIRAQPAAETAPASMRSHMAETVVPSASSLSSPEYPPGESAKKVIPRRPVGTSKREVEGLQQKKSTPELSGFGPRSPTQPSSSSSHRSPSPRSSSRPHQSRSSSALNSATGHDVQETVMAQASAALARPPVTQVPGSEQTSAPIAQGLRTPANTSEPLGKPELFELVSTLNEADQSPRDLAPRKVNAPAPSRRVAPNTPAVPLSDVNEAVEEDSATKGMELTEAQTEQLNHALARFPRNWETSSPSNGIWRAGPLLEKHHNCYTKHGTFVFAKNVNYSIACQTCGVEDSSHRKVCSWCNLRVCMKCHGILQTTGRELKTLLAILEEERRQEKGKDKEVVESAAGADNHY